MKDTRPMFLDLTKIKFPPTAIVSILHRVSGVVLFLFIPLLLWIFGQSLASAQSFDYLIVTLASPGFKVTLWVLLAALLFHLLAGLRHLLFDFVLEEDYAVGRRWAYIIFVLSAIAAIAAAVWMWRF